MSKAESNMLLVMIVLAASAGAWAWAISLTLAGVVVAAVTSAGWLK